MSPAATDRISETVCLTIDVDWASAEVLADMVRLLDDRKLKATFFCTHAGIEVPGHERALHPNFRHRGDTMRRLRQERGDPGAMTEPAIYEYVVRTTLEFCPEARGVRGHSLLYDSQLLPIYHAVGLEYESSYLLPLTPGLHPVYKEYNLLEIPIYANDHFLLKVGAREFRTSLLKLDRPGLKVCQFHPNMVFLNAAADAHYQDARADYHDAEALRQRRHKGRGVRDLFLDLLDELANRRRLTCTLGEVNATWRATEAAPW
jgi:hypothetical protein